jgi:hypothetical protein
LAEQSRYFTSQYEWPPIVARLLVWVNELLG